MGEDLDHIPSFLDCNAEIPIQPWMFGQKLRIIEDVNIGVGGKLGVMGIHTTPLVGLAPGWQTTDRAAAITVPAIHVSVQTDRMMTTIG